MLTETYIQTSIKIGGRTLQGRTKVSVLLAQVMTLAKDTVNTRTQSQIDGNIPEIVTTSVNVTDLVSGGRYIVTSPSNRTPSLSTRLHQLEVGKVYRMYGDVNVADGTAFFRPNTQFGAEEIAAESVKAEEVVAVADGNGGDPSKPF